MIVTASVKANKLVINKVQQFETGDTESAAIYENFPRSVAIRLCTDSKGQKDAG